MYIVLGCQYNIHIDAVIQTAVTVWQITDAVDTVVCARDDGWSYHPKNFEQFPDVINCVTLHLVGYILEYTQHFPLHILVFILLILLWYILNI